MCDLLEKKSSVLSREIFNQFERSQYLSQLSLNGPVPISRPNGTKRILYRGKSGQMISERGVTEREEEQDPSGNQRKAESKKMKRTGQRDSQRKSAYTSTKAASEKTTAGNTTTVPSPSTGGQASPWFERFNCLKRNAKISTFQTKFLELTSLNKPTGPHGRYCFCGCRGELPS
jgi:hypothetical protein